MYLFIAALIVAIPEHAISQESTTSPSDNSPAIEQSEKVEPAKHSEKEDELNREAGSFPNVILTVDVVRRKDEFTDVIRLAAGRRNFGVELELLACSEIRKELELSDEQTTTIQSLLDEIDEFNGKHKFRSRIKCAVARQAANEFVQKLRKQIEESRLRGDLLDEHQRNRLRQIMRRYVLSCGATCEQFFSTSLSERLKLSESDRSTILGILDEELTRWRKEYDATERWQQILAGGASEEQEEKIKNLCDKYANGVGLSPILYAAQLNLDPLQILSRQSDRSYLDDEFIQAFCGFQDSRGMILFDGSIFPLYEYLDIGQNHLQAPVSTALEHICSSDAQQYDWLELVDWQIDELRSLRDSAEIVASQDGIKKAFADFSNSTSLKQLELREKRLCVAMKTSELQLAQKVQEILMPEQLDTLQLALEYRNVVVYGPVKSCLSGMIGRDIGFSKSQKRKILKRISEERDLFIESENELEDKILSKLTLKQRSEYDMFLGAPVKVLPSFWWALACQHQRSRHGKGLQYDRAHVELK